MVIIVRCKSQGTLRLTIALRCVCCCCTQCFVVSTLVSMTPAAPFLFRNYEFPASAQAQAQQVPSPLSLPALHACLFLRSPGRSLRSAGSAAPAAHGSLCITGASQQFGTVQGHHAGSPASRGCPRACALSLRARMCMHACSCAPAPAAAATTCGRPCARPLRRPTTWTTSSAAPTGARHAPSS
jgi:hypothetical protein